MGEWKLVRGDCGVHGRGKTVMTRFAVLHPKHSEPDRSRVAVWCISCAHNRMGL